MPGSTMSRQSGPTIVKVMPTVSSRKCSTRDARLKIGKTFWPNQRRNRDNCKPVSNLRPHHSTIVPPHLWSTSISLQGRRLARNTTAFRARTFRVGRNRLRIPWKGYKGRRVSGMDAWLLVHAIKIAMCLPVNASPMSWDHVPSLLITIPRDRRGALWDCSRKYFTQGTQAKLFECKERVCMVKFFLVDLILHCRICQTFLICIRKYIQAPFLGHECFHKMQVHEIFYCQNLKIFAQDS